MTFSKWLFIALLAFCTRVGASPFFDDDSVLEVTLTGPLHALIAGKNKASGALSFTLGAGGAEHQVKVRPRGRSRLRVCDFPPLRLDFTSADTGGSIFAGQDKLRLVTHCNEGERAGQNVLEEFAAYRIFNQISDESYRVRLLRITYVDTDGRFKGSPLVRYGFVSESEYELTARVDGRLAHVAQVARGSVNERQAAAVYIFQYLIGNTDWSLVTPDSDDSCCHNGTLVEIDGEMHYVPYDFDLAGLVDARYAKPDRALRIRRVTQRLYRGYCVSRTVLQTALTDIKLREAAILGVVKALPGLSATNRADKLEFLRKFFLEAEDEEKLLQSFQRRCL